VLFFMIQVSFKNWMENLLLLRAAKQQKDDKAAAFSVDSSSGQSLRGGVPVPLANTGKNTAAHAAEVVDVTKDPQREVPSALTVPPLVESASLQDENPQHQHHHHAEKMVQTPSLCSRDRIRNGHWKYVPQNTTRYTLPEKAWENVCNRKGIFPAPDPWEWAVDKEGEEQEEDQCLFESFDVDTFCRWNSNRNIVFLGDSLAWQQFNSLNYWIGGIDVERERGWIETRACNNSTKLKWRRNDNANVHSINDLLRLDPAVIVINKGAHYRENEVFEKELNATFARIVEWQKDCDQIGKDCHLIWRTTAPGFPECQQVPGPIPIHDKAKAEATVSNASLPWYAGRQDYHWWDFKEQNGIVERLSEAFAKEQGLRMSFVDFYEIGLLRPDLHVGNRGDCLHYCMPGPLDAVNTVLLHELIRFYSRSARQ